MKRLLSILSVFLLLATSMPGVQDAFAGDRSERRDRLERAERPDVDQDDDDSSDDESATDDA